MHILYYCNTDSQPSFTGEHHNFNLIFLTMGITNNSDPVTCTSITYTKNKVAFLKSQTKEMTLTQG